MLLHVFLQRAILGRHFGNFAPQLWQARIVCCRPAIFGGSHSPSIKVKFNWIIQLAEAKDEGEIQNGAQFVARFVKNRNATEADCPPLEWHFNKPKDETRARVNWKKISTAQIFQQWIEDGVTSAKDIAEEMGISKGQVSKLAKRAMTDGWLKKDGRDYALTGLA